jgi:hypothetical protein
MSNYLVTWQIDMNDVPTPAEAAARALLVMRDDDPANTAVCFTVVDKETGEITTEDLADADYEAVWKPILEAMDSLLAAGVSTSCAGRCGWEMALHTFGQETEEREIAALRIASHLNADWTEGAGIGVCLAPNWRDHIKK